MKKYNYQEFKNDPHTKSYNGNYPRYIKALFDCIDNKKTSSEEIFAEIDKAYLTAKHCSPSRIKQNKLKAIKLFNKFVFD